MNASSLVKVVLASTLVLLLMVFLRDRNGAPSGTADEPPAPKAVGSDTGRVGARESQNAAAAVQQRLQELRNSRDGWEGEAARGGGSAPPPAARPAAPAAAQPGNAAPPPAQGGNVAAAKKPLRDNEADDIPALKQIATSDADAERRIEALTILGATEDPGVVPVLGQALSDSDPEVRLAAIQSLADFTGDAPAELLSKAAMEDTDEDNRYEALEALGDMESDRAATVAKAFLNDPTTSEDLKSLAESTIEDLQDEGSAGDQE